MRSYHGRGLHGQVVDAVGRQVVQGVLPVGATIDVLALEAQFGVSRTIMRETMKVLASKGLVDARQKRGTFVRPRADWNLLDGDVMAWGFAVERPGALLRQLAEVREIVEPAGAALAAVRRTPQDLLVLEQAIQAMAAAPDAAAAVKADLTFHRALLAASGNELLERMEVLIGLVLAERDRLVLGVIDTADSLPSHRAVLEAVRNQDADLARALMRSLLAKAMTDVERASLRTHTDIA